MADNKVLELVAWWGASLSTIVFLWDIYKWKTSGPRLKVDVSGNMQYFEQGTGRVDDKEYVVVNISNVGRRLTTITNIGMQYYDSRIKQLFKKPEANFIIPTPNQNYPTPHRLEAGTTWMATIVQTPKVVEMTKKGILDCLIYHSHSNKPVRKRISITEKKKDVKGGVSG